MGHLVAIVGAHAPLTKLRLLKHLLEPANLSVVELLLCFEALLNIANRCMIEMAQSVVESAWVAILGELQVLSIVIIQSSVENINALIDLSEDFVCEPMVT